MNSTKFKKPFRYGFTLVELLFVIAIIAVLSTMSLGIMRSAQNDAKESATLSRIRAIEAILKIQLEDYEVRRLPVSISTLKGLTSGSGTMVQLKNLRHQIIADLINVEMPRPFETGSVYEDNSNGASGVEIGDFTPGSTLQSLNIPRTAAMNRWVNIKKAGFNLPGEYLYEILNAIDIDGTPGIEMLGNRAVGDADDDLIPEVVDAWGEPLYFEIQQLQAVAGSDTFIFIDGIDYVPLDTIVPRSVNKIRIVVKSNHPRMVGAQ